MEDKKIVDSHSLSIVNIVKQTFKTVFHKPLYLLVPFVCWWLISFLISLFFVNYSNPISILMSWNLNVGTWKYIFAILFWLLDVLMVIFLSLLSILSVYKIVKWEKLDRQELLNQIKEKYLWILWISALQFVVIIVPIMLFGVLSVFIPILWFFIAIAGIVFGIIAFVRLIFADYFYLFEWKNIKESIKESSIFVKKVDSRDVFFKYIWLSIAFGFIALIRYFIFVPRLSSLLLSLWFGSWTFVMTLFSQIVKYLFYVFMVVAWTFAYMFYKDKQHLKEQWQNIEEKKEKFWCFFYGCIGFLILFVLWTISMIFAINKFVKYTIQNWTTEQVMPLPLVSLETWDIVQWIQKFENLQNMIRFNSWESMFLTEKDLNATMYFMSSWTVQSWENISDYIVFKIENWQLDTYFSLPLEKLKLKILKWRFLNWKLWFILKADKIYPVYLSLVDWEINGEKIPFKILEQFKQANLLQSMYQQSYQYPQLLNIKSAQINQENQIVIEVFGEDNSTSNFQ